MSSLLTNASQRKLLRKWGPILESGTPIQSETTKMVLAQILENTREFYKRQSMLNEAGIVAGDPNGPVGAQEFTKGNGAMRGTAHYPYVDGQYGDYYLPNVVMPMLRRIMPDLIANELVSVQPLNGPVGYALAYRPVYGANGGLGKDGQYSAGKEIGYAPTDTRFTGVSATNEASAVVSGNYWTAYAGLDNGAWAGDGATLGPGSEYANVWGQDYGGQNANYPMTSFGLVKSMVEAKTRKLAAMWSPELAEDMQAMHGIDVEREMINTLTYEVGAEIDRQIITEMVKAAIVGKSVSDWNPTSADGLDQMGRLATLLTQITIEAQNIAVRTRRGNANFVVTTPRVCALLQQLSMNKFVNLKPNAEMPSVPDTGVGALTKIGLINDGQQLLVRDSYASVGDAQYVLMGYKGKGPGDSGIIYCPYVPLQLSKVLQPGAFVPSIGARTRYGIMANPYDAKNYYHFMRITGLADTYAWNTDRRFIAEPSTIPLEGQNQWSETVFKQA